MYGVTVHDVEELNNKLVSDRAKVREDGLKILQSFLQSSGESSLWTLLDEETARLDHHGRIRSSTWPGILHALCVCIENEVAASKRKAPKAAFAKALRSFVLKAEDASRPGQNLSLLRKAKRLFQHVLDILQRVPSYVSDYNNILCQLLHVFEYRMRMGKKIYSDLLHFYLEKAKEISRTITTEVSLAREEAFRNSSSLHALLQHPPGDLPEVLMVNIVDDFVEIFMHLGDEGRIAKKLLASLNSFLLTNGLNIGFAAGNIHASMKTYMYRVWFTTRDRELKDGLVLYARIQLKLRYILASDKTEEISDLLELVEKELDQSGVALSALYRLDVVREEKPSTVSKALRAFLELAAAVLSEAITTTENRLLRDGKKRKKTDICTVIKDRLMDGKFLWGGAFCLLIRRFGVQLSADVILGWLEGLASSLDRIMLEGINARVFEGPLWTLRCLQELACIWWKIFPLSTGQNRRTQVATTLKGETAWQSIWNVLLHCLPLLNNVQVMVEETFRLLGVLAAQGVVSTCTIPQDFWDIHQFDEVPSGNMLYFITAFFGSSCSQMVADDGKIRAKLLDWCMTSLEAQEVHRTRFLFGEQNSPALLSAAVLALSFGVISCISNSRDTVQLLKKELSWPSSETEPYLEADESDRGQERDLAALDRSESVLVATKDSSQQDNTYSSAGKTQLPLSASDVLLGKAADHLLRHAAVASHISQRCTLPQLLHLSSILAICIDGVKSITERRGQIPSEWSPKGALWRTLANILERSISRLYDVSETFASESSSPISDKIILLEPFSHSALESVQQYVSYGGSCNLVAADGTLSSPEGHSNSQPLLEKLLVAACQAFSAARKMTSMSVKVGHAGSKDPFTIDLEKPSQEMVAGKRIVDLDFDLDADNGLGPGGNVGDNTTTTSLPTRSASVNNIREKNGDWTSIFIQIVAAIGRVLPAATCTTLMNLLLDEEDLKVYGDILLGLCKIVSRTNSEYIPALVRKIQDLLPDCQRSETTRSLVLSALAELFHSLIDSKKQMVNSDQYGVKKKKEKWLLTEQVSTEIAELIERVVNMGLIFWGTRLKLLEVLSGFVVLDPSGAQVLIEKFLVLLHDSDYHVRLSLSRKVTVLFETWDGHDELLPDICANFGVKIGMMTTDKGYVAGETMQGPHQVTMAETALLTLGNIAVSSEKVESNVVFTICAHLASNSRLRSLGCAVLNKIADRLSYPNRWQYLDQLAGQLMTYWVMANINVSSLLEVREMFAEVLDVKEFFQQFCPWLLPALVFYGRTEEISWLATVMSVSVPDLIKQHFVSIFAGILPLHLGSSKGIQKRAADALQMSMLTLAEISEDERDELIQRQMVSIVCALFGLCGARDKPVLPYFPKQTVITSVKTVVDGFLDSEQVSQDDKLKDKMQIFRADRVFVLLLQLHQDLDAAYHPRHRGHMLTSLGALVEVLELRVAVPSTCRYIILIVLQSMAFVNLQQQCCVLMSSLLDKLYSSGLEGCYRILGEQLQGIVSKLVPLCITLYRNEAPVASVSSPHKLLAINGGSHPSSSSVIALLRQLTVDAHHSLHKYIKDLDPFPSLPCFEPMRTFQQQLSVTYTLAEEFVQFVRRAPTLPPKARVSSLQNLCSQLSTRRKELFTDIRENQRHQYWRCSPRVVDAVWRLIHLCDKDDNTDLNDLAGEFLAAVGVGDPHAVVFHLPDKIHDYHTSLLQESSVCHKEMRHMKDVSVDPELGLSDDLLKCILLQLRSYLVDSDVNVIQLAYKTLKGVLSTQRGQSVFLSMNQEDKTYLEMYSRGVNLRIEADMVDAAKRKSAETAISLGVADLWQTSGKAYDAWICMLTYSLVELTDDIILRLCQDMLSVKASLAELLFPHVFGNLAGKFGSDVEFCNHISKQIEEHVFDNTNQSTRSLQLFLNMLNSLRQCYIEAGLKRLPGDPKRRERTKVDKHGVSGGSRSRRKNSSSGDQTVGSTDSTVADHADQGPTSWIKVYWFHIDYLATAKAAQQCAAYFTSALYVEHWCEETYGSLTLGPPDFSSDDELPAHLELLVRVYTRINEPDGVYGVVRSHKVTSQLLRYEHEGNWSKALENYDLLLRSSSSGTVGTKRRTRDGVFRAGAALKKSVLKNSTVLQNSQLIKGLMRSLQQKGCSHVLDMYSSGVSQQDGIRLDAEFKEIQYEEAWRTGKWDYGVSVPSSLKQASEAASPRNTDLSFHENLHSSLKSLMEGDAEMFVSSLKAARQEIVTYIAHTSLESTQNVNPLIVKLQILDCVSEAWKMRWRVSRHQTYTADMLSTDMNSSISGPLVPTTKQIDAFNASWQENLDQMQAHYELAEPYIAIRKVLLELLGLHRCIPQHLLQFSSFARKAGRVNHAGSSIHDLKLLCNVLLCTEDTEIDSNSKVVISRHLLAGQVEEAKVLWADGQQEMAVNLAQHVLQLQSDEENLAPLLCLTGKWLAETRSSSSHMILDSYLKRAVVLSGSGKNTEDHQETSRMCRTSYRLAHYADALYRNHQERLMSSEWQAALRLRQHKARELEALKKRLIILRADTQEDPSKVREYSMKFVELHRQLTLDNEEAQRLQDDKNQFLILALASYGSCLSISNKYDLRVVFRLVSLWFNLSATEEVVEAMLETVQKVQTYKFLPLVYQIASRLGSSKESQGAIGFQNALTLLLEKMATDHPYHSLYQLFALANGDRIKEKQRGKNVFVVDMEKKRAAEELLDKLIAKKPELLLQIRNMIEIYIQLAELETTQKDANKKTPIPRNIRNVKELELVPVITAHLPVDYSCRYSPESFVHFKAFTDGITVMNGINAPKCIDCLGSDGNKYRQLAKSGNDDMRQDAVMEQLFGLVNNLLQAHPDTQKRNLGIRTYKVIPFTPSAGVLEWVNGTIPLGEYLLGSTRAGGAHGRYGGDDWTFMMCREHMSTAKDKLTAYQAVCENFRPVMHHFFLEKFAQPEDWFERRLAYTRSVATSSMVGYIVGLGDRHSVNILMDQVTAEVVHIDLGVAFEQGLMLKTPERVPFRLTRDVVDGMGVTGVEGVFRRVCEATLSVLRENKEALLTIIEVFIYDPLYNWALSPLKALQRQQELDDMEDSLPESDNMAEMEGNKDAARALFRVKQKLDGYEEGEMRSLQGQVQQLIHDAQDPERLSQLFPGWGAWV